MAAAWTVAVLVDSLLIEGDEKQSGCQVLMLCVESLSKRRAVE